LHDSAYEPALGPPLTDRLVVVNIVPVIDKADVLKSQKPS